MEKPLLTLLLSGAAFNSDLSASNRVAHENLTASFVAESNSNLPLKLRSYLEYMILNNILSQKILYLRPSSS